MNETNIHFHIILCLKVYVVVRRRATERSTKLRYAIRSLRNKIEHLYRVCGDITFIWKL